MERKGGAEATALTPADQHVLNVFAHVRFVQVEIACSRVWGLGFGVWGLELGVWSLGFGVWGLGFEV